MSEVSDTAEKSDRRGKIILGAVVLAVVIAAVLGVLYVRTHNTSQEAAVPGIEHAGPLGRYAKGSLAKLNTWAHPKAAGAIAFNDADGKPVSLATFRGKVVVVNFWATWCAPCRTEMPTLAALQRRYPNDVVVVPLSEDRDNAIDDAKSFIGVHDPLSLFHDPSVLALPFSMGVRILPATVIYDRQGREVARLIGPSAWDSPDADAFFDALLKER
ncbi:MAG TPA: TlpA disulfide reductase family protein [Caulobacteraceae bacterium]|jgi:thiol-disulfide isomerase/thioredoxin|nr:TlpA disulfide reductase family protein [Caulobacteraceae bacterium]